MTTYRVVVEGPCEHGRTETHRYGMVNASLCPGVERFEVPGEIYIGPVDVIDGEAGPWVRAVDFAEAVVNIEKGAIHVPEER